MSGLVRSLKEITPFYVKGIVAHGFRRGSTMLQMPTANLSYDSLLEKSEKPQTGVYFGWTSLRTQVYPSVINIGNNPSFNNEHVTIEVYLIHTFDFDFYDEELRVLVCGFDRSEYKFASFNELKQTMHEDARLCNELLLKEPFLHYKNDKFFL
ncbi:hypothetical protein WA158_002361 [Blastocystis sp. Blastoise]